LATIYTEAQVTDWLQTNLPSWTIEQGNLVRTFVTGNWQLTLLLANTIGYLAEAAWHHPEMILSYPRLTVRLQTHDVSGITDKDLELARRIEQIAVWRPSKGDALEGTPNRWVK